jgi:signal transduction histidine kinase
MARRKGPSGLPRKRFFSSVSSKVILSFMSVVALQGIISILAVNWIVLSTADSTLYDHSTRTANLIGRFFSDADNELLVKANLLSGQQKIVSLASQRATAGLSEELRFYVSALKLDAVYVVGPDGEAIASAGNLESVAMARKRLVHEEYPDRNLILSGQGNRIQLWALSPVVGTHGQYGTLCAAISLDRAFLGRIEEMTDSNLLLRLRKSILVNGRVSDNVFIYYDRVQSAEAEAPESGSFGDIVFHTVYLKGYEDLQAVYFIDTSGTASLIAQHTALSVLILALTLVAAFFIGLLLYQASFQKPFAAFQSAVRRLSSGDMSFDSFNLSNDEFGELEREFVEMTMNLQKLEEKLQVSSRMAAIGEMVAGVAHQIRNPLAIMRVSAELLRDSAPVEGPPRSDRERELVAVILSEIDSLSITISKFLDFTRPLSVSKERVDVAACVHDAIAFLPMDQFPGVEVEVRASPGLAEYPMDKHLIGQVVMNLVMNALQASPRGSIVAVRVEPRGERVAISIKDQGIGMSEETRKNIFNPFFTTKREGTGLGLSIVLRIVESHGGSVEVKSRLGEGSEFTVVV